MKLEDYFEPGVATFCFLSDDVKSGDFEETALLSIAISLRRIADAMAPKAESTGRDWPDAPNPETQFSADAQHLNAADADLGAGIELARALLMMHRSGRYHGMILSHENIRTGERGLIAPLGLLGTLFHGKSEAEIQRQLLAIPGSDTVGGRLNGEISIFVSMADIDA